MAGLLHVPIRRARTRTSLFKDHVENDGFRGRVRWCPSACPSACPRDLLRCLAQNAYFCGRVHWCPSRVRQRVRVICQGASYGMLTFVGVSVGVRHVSVNVSA